MRNLTWIFCVSLVLEFGVPAQAATILSLSSSPANLDNLSIGQNIQIEVELSGLLTGDELDSLATTIVYDGTVLGAPTITVGAIIPDPLDDPFDLLTATGGGLADVTFLTFSTDSANHIVANDVFFTLDLQVIGPGSGSIAFDFVGATVFNDGDPANPRELNIEPGPALPFSSVPEPAALPLLILAAVLMGIQRCPCNFLDNRC